MKFTFLMVSLTLLATELSGQWMVSMNEDSLSEVLKKEKDTIAVQVMLQLGGSYFFRQPATTLEYAIASIDSSKRLHYEIGIIQGSEYAGEASRLIGDFIPGLKFQQDANERSIRIGNRYWEANSAGGMGMTYYELGNFKESLSNLKRAVELHKTIDPDPHEALYNVYVARDYIEMKEYDLAYDYLKDAAQYFHIKPERGKTVRWKMVYHIVMGDYHHRTGRPDSAYVYWKAALKLASNSQDAVFNHVSLAAAKLSSLFSEKKQLDSSMYYARLAFKVATNGQFNPRIPEVSRQLADLYESMGKTDSALYYMRTAITVNKSMFGTDKVNELQLLLLDEQKRNIEIQQEEERHQNNIRLISLVSITTIILVASLLLFRSNRIKQKTNLVLQQTLNELKATQSQLIQSEKMASLGELTAGIAHEIQNPLNFVNNFSEVNKELIEELTQQAREGNLKEVQNLAGDIKANEDKIEQHGKRADAIVKSMLQHSRVSSGKKELTDINALCDEYTRLAYHGYRAKDKSFNAKLDTDLDQKILPIQAITQDIGRVILNLANNAFHAVTEKSKSAQDGYTPTVSITTKRLSDKIEINVKDNGKGIPEAIKEKIFQPFFTTKSAGQGTGLGLSLSYDIIKAHGGTIFVNSKEGEGSEFIVQLPG